MNAISTPATNLVVYNTDLSSLMRYDGASWVSMASGYGLVSVNDSSGVPTFYSDLQDALETCKTSGGVFTVKLHSNITLSSSININSTGSGVGNGYVFDTLTIDGNGFKIEFDDSASTNAINITVPSRNINFLNLIVERLNGTGTHYAIYNNDGAMFNMSNCYVYCQNGTSFFMASEILDLGKSIFESGGSLATVVIGNNSDCRNFNAKSNGSGVAVDNNKKASYFTCENTSTGQAYNGDPDSEGSFFLAKSNTGNCIDNGNGSAICTNFKAISVSGIAVKTDSSGRFVDFYAETGNNTALRCDLSFIYNGVCVNNSTSPTVYSVRCQEIDNLFCKNNGSGYALDSFQNTSATINRWNKITAISIGGIAGTIRSNAGQIKNSTFISTYNNANGHAIFLQVNGCSLLNCIFEVVNSSANGINATSAITANIANCTINGATTPINANITVNTSTDLGDGNRSY